MSISHHEALCKITEISIRENCSVLMCTSKHNSCGQNKQISKKLSYYFMKRVLFHKMPRNFIMLMDRKFKQITD